MPDSEKDAQEVLRQAQEQRRESGEIVRQAQEGVREVQEHTGEDSRTEAETNRVGAEEDRVGAAEGAASAEAGRVQAEGLREVAEKARAERDRIMVLSPDLEICGVTDEYLRMVERDRSIIGMNVFEAFPDTDPDQAGRGKLERSLQRVRDTLTPDEMDLLEYPIQLSDGSWETRFWQVTNIPVTDKDGNLDRIINRVSRVRDLEAFRETVRVEREQAIDRAVRRLRTWQNVLYGVTAVIVVAFAFQFDRESDRITRKAVHATQDVRQGCERQNVLRANQADLIRDQMETTAALLSRKGGLGTLEPFRAEITEQQAQRQRSLDEARRSVADHPVAGKPYHLDCAAAFPLRRNGG